MEFKKCVRCGSFFVSEGDVCQNCMPKDRLDIIKFKLPIEESNRTLIKIKKLRETSHQYPRTMDKIKKSRN